jgi:hypothetical protein
MAGTRIAAHFWVMLWTVLLSCGSSVLSQCSVTYICRMVVLHSFTFTTLLGFSLAERMTACCWPLCLCAVMLHPYSNFVWRQQTILLLLAQVVL